MDILKFLEDVNKLKKIKRTGWVERGVKEAETVGEHSFMVALQAIVLCNNKDIDVEKILKMAIVHDIAESKIGDLITKEVWPNGGTISEKEKYKIEKEAFSDILNSLEAETKEELLSLWKEFEESKTKEAVFVKSIDKFEALYQALLYKKDKNYIKHLDGFWDEEKIKLIKDKDVKEIALKAIKRLNKS